MGVEYLNNKYLERLIVRFKNRKLRKEEIEELISQFDLYDGGPEGSPFGLDRRDELGVEYTKVVRQFEVIQGRLADAFFTLAENIANYAKFNYVDIDDAIQESVLICFDKIDRFNPDLGKSFNYFTTISINSLRQMYRCSRNYNELKRKYHTHLQGQEKQVFSSRSKDRPHQAPNFLSET